MIDLFNKYRKNLQKEVVKRASLYDYRYVRYNINYSITACYVNEPTDLMHIASNLRQSDDFIKLNDHLYVMFLDATDDEQGIKTSTNILNSMQAQFFTKPFYIAVVTATNYTDLFQMIHDLFDLIEYALLHNMNNIVIDSSQLIKNDQSV
ncbi:MAG: hypothetical protein NTY39_12450 [Campylobacterales bacterium]|nr:hypothetical protein [Campylobacterales bacterium]